MTGEKKIDFSKLNFKVVSTGKRSDGTNKEKSAEESIKNDKEIKRTIEYVIDVETEEIIDAKEYFKNDESVIFKTKRRLQEAILGIASPKFICINCEQKVNLNVKKERNGYYFAHHKDSDECDIKTSRGLSLGAILEEIFNKKKNESDRHKKLKMLMAAYLQSNKDRSLGISDIEVESRISHKLFESKWRQPDVFGIYNGTRIAFELHLSTTFLSVIIGREVFYRTMNTFVLWIFNFESPFIESQSTMVKNVTYSNNRNYFEIDEETIKRSNEVHDLVLRCHWQEIEVVNDTEKVEWKNEYISLSDLTFNQETYQVYYYDSEANLTDKERELSKIDWDEKYRLYIEKNRAIDKELNAYKRKKEKDEKLDRARIDNINNFITDLRNGSIIPKEFEKNKRFGFEVNGKVIIEARYSEVSPFKDGLARVKRNRKYGFVDLYGKEIIECEFIQAFDVKNGKCIMRFKKDWFCIDLNEKSYLQLDYSSIEQYSSNLLIVTHDEEKEVYAGTRRTGYDYRTGKYYGGYKKVYKNIVLQKYGLISLDGEVIVKADYDEIREFQNGKIVLREGKKWGCFDDSGNELIPFEYQFIGDFTQGQVSAKKDGLNGVINETGNPIVPFEFKQVDI